MCSYFTYFTAALIHQYSEETDDLKLTLSRQESTIEGQRVEIEQLKSVLQDKSVLLASSDREKMRASQEATEVKKMIETLRKSSPDSVSETVQYTYHNVIL